MAPDFLLELIPSMLCSPLRVVTADALYRFVCRRNTIATGTEALSLRKIVSPWLIFYIYIHYITAALGVNDLTV